MTERPVRRPWQRLRSRLRVEDLLAGGFALALTAYAGARAALSGLRLDESDLWDFSFILAPLAILVFGTSLRYALGGGASLLRSTLRQLGALLRDWLPFLLLLLSYEAFRTRIWMLLVTEDKDAALLAWDRRLFGETPSVWMERWLHPVLTDFLTLAYFLHLVLPPVVAYAFYRRSRDAFRAFLLAVLLAGILGSIGYLLVPAVGPQVAFPELYHRELESQLYHPVTSLMDAARAPRDVFPSLHVAISSLVLWYGARLGRGWLWALFPWVIGNWWATLYLRYHYLVDLLAGFLLAVAAVALSSWLLRREALWKGSPACDETSSRS